MPQLHSFPHTKDRKFVLKLKEHDSPLYPNISPCIPLESERQRPRARANRVVWSESDHFCRTPENLSDSDHFCRSPTNLSDSGEFVGLRPNLSDSDQIRRTDHTVNPADAISQKRASYKPKERGNESPRAQCSLTSRIHLVASPQGAGKRIIKSPEPHNCSNPLQ